MTDPVEALAAALREAEKGSYDYGEMAHTSLAALRASGFDVVPTGDDSDDDQWSIGYDEGFAAAKRLCEALERAEPVPTGDAGLDVERLEAAIDVGWRTTGTIHDLAVAIAAEYARLSSSDTGHDHHDECDCGLPPSSDTGGRG